MNDAFETADRPNLPPPAELWREGGVYHVRIVHPACEGPIHVALHGISTPEQASEALLILHCPECGTMKNQSTSPDGNLVALAP